MSFELNIIILTSGGSPPASPAPNPQSNARSHRPKLGNSARDATARHRCSFHARSGTTTRRARGRLLKRTTSYSHVQLT